MKKFIKDYLSFSRKESYAAISIMFIAAIFIALPLYNSSKKNKEPVNTTLNKLSVIKQSSNDSSDNNNTDDDVLYHQKTYAKKQSSEGSHITPFQFDPNTLDEAGFQKLGLSAKLIKTMMNYRSKGGTFKTPEDIRKIWGLKKEDADMLVPYITIVAKANNYKPSNNYNKFQKPQPTIIDVNTATVEDFKVLPGVGNLAYKIVKFREKLGGFININQVKETYGMTDSVYMAMQPFLSFSATNIQKLNINTLSDFELGKHPYISREVAKAIAIYRTQHGSYTRLEDIKKIVFINQATYQKIVPYLTVE